jgi:ectoine hydroxylase-related dioxygenase (phytanoyl-CoA dioxygenase family)
MRDQATPEQIASYRENGFIVIEDFLDAAELEHWSSTTEAAVAQRLAATARKDHGPLPQITDSLTNQGDPKSYYARVFTQCLKLAESHDGMHALMHDPRLGKLAATLAGVDGIRIWHDQALFKPPYGNPTAWHNDNPFWSFYSRDALSIWVALDDATLANGALFYLPGSHKEARFENAGIGEGLADLFEVYPHWLEIDPVACPVRAGSAIFHNGLTGHGAGANMTNKPRRAMTCAYMPDGSVFNGQQNVLPDAYVQSLNVGDPLNDDGVNPLIWSAELAA